MSITREDILRFTEFQGNEKQLELFEYWSPPEYEDPRLKSPLDMVKEYSRVSNQKPDHVLYNRLIAEEFNEWDDQVSLYSVKSPDYKPEDELKELSDLVYVIYGYANAKGWNLDEAVRRVHENNMGRMYQPDGTIKRRPDGKIEKNKNYPKVHLGDLV